MRLRRLCSALGRPRLYEGCPRRRRPDGARGLPVGLRAHVWVFFSGPVEATIARRIGAGLLREAIAMRGELDLSSYDRFFPSQDYLPRSGSIGNLIALPLQGACRKRGTTVFLDLATLEPHI